MAQHHPTESDVLHITMHIARLRANAPYREAELMRRQLGPEGAKKMATSPQDSPEYAALRLLVGTWNRIAILIQSFSTEQKHRFFRCHPIGLTWEVLEPGVTIIRKALQPHYANYGRQLEALAKEYDKWAANEDDYRTREQQSVCADFG